jgi:mannose-6-phosphate isomerase
MKIDPFMLRPEYREYVWGGNRIRPNVERTAEAWLVYEQNMIIDGPLKGKTLSEAAESEGEALLGRYVVNCTGKRFPLLIKLLDCADWLSLQVHPNNVQAEFWEGPGHFGKTEAWYIVEAEDGAQLISGFKPGTTHDEIKQAVGTSALLDIVDRKEVNKGNAILISPGTMHALGPGLLIYEVQQTSDITYRVYDWDRPVKSSRKLHLEQAADVLDLNAGGDLIALKKPPIAYEKIISSEFFELLVTENNDQPVQYHTENNSFHCLTMIDGEGVIKGDGWQRKLGKFGTLVIPATCGRYHIQPGVHTWLTAFVPG